MIKLQIYFVVILFLTACGTNSERKFRADAMSVAEDYVRGQLVNPEKKIQDNGAVSLSDPNLKYFIDPSSLLTGYIDNDRSEDALITVFSSRDGYPARTEHLFLINVNGALTMQRSIESDMKILELKDGIITAEIHTHPKSSPLYNCPVCREVVKYRYVSGELVRAD